MLVKEWCPYNPRDSLDKRRREAGQNSGGRSDDGTSSNGASFPGNRSSACCEQDGLFALEMPRQELIGLRRLSVGFFFEQGQQFSASGPSVFCGITYPFDPMARANV